MLTRMSSAIITCIFISLSDSDVIVMWPIDHKVGTKQSASISPSLNYQSQIRVEEDERRSRRVGDDLRRGIPEQ